MYKRQVRLQAVLLVQDEMFGEILLRKHKMFDTVFSGDAKKPGASATLKGIDEQYL